MAEAFHCFWRASVGGAHQYEVTDSADRVQELKLAEDKELRGDYGNVRNLVVVYGERMGFEPVEVALKYKIGPECG